MTVMGCICWLTSSRVNHLGDLWLAQGDVDLLSSRVLGLNSRRRFNRWWLRFDVIQDFLDDVWVSDVGDDAHGAATQGA